MTPPGDDGGGLTNGAIHTGTIVVGDIDRWTFGANVGETISMSINANINMSANISISMSMSSDIRMSRLTWRWRWSLVGVGIWSKVLLVNPQAMGPGNRCRFAGCS